MVNVSPAALAETTVMAASAVAAPPASRTVIRSRSQKAMPATLEPLEHPDESLRPLDGQVGLAGNLRRGLNRGDGDADGVIQLAILAQGSQGGEGVNVGAVIAAVERGIYRTRRDQSSYRDALVDRDVRPDLQHLAPSVGNETLPLGLAGDVVGEGLRGSLVVGAAPMQGDDRPFVLRPDPHSLQLGAVEVRHEVRGVGLVTIEGRVRFHLVLARE